MYVFRFGGLEFSWVGSLSFYVRSFFCFIWSFAYVLRDTFVFIVILVVDFVV